MRALTFDESRRTHMPTLRHKKTLQTINIQIVRRKKPTISIIIRYRQLKGKRVYLPVISAYS